MGGQGPRGAGGAGLTAKSSKLLAQYSSCSKLPQGTELLSGARLQGHDKLGQGWGPGHGHRGAPAVLQPLHSWTPLGPEKSEEEQRAPDLWRCCEGSQRPRAPDTHRKRSFQKAGSRSGSGHPPTSMGRGLRVPDGVQGCGSFRNTVSTDWVRAPGRAEREGG